MCRRPIRPGSRQVTLARVASPSDCEERIGGKCMRPLLANLFYLGRRHRYLAIWGAGLLLAAVTIVGAFMPFSPLTRLNFLVFDTYQQLRPRAVCRELGPRGRYRRRQHSPDRPVALVEDDARPDDRPAGRTRRRHDRSRHHPVRARPHVAGTRRRAAGAPGVPGHLSGRQRGARSRPYPGGQLCQCARRRGSCPGRDRQYAAAAAKGRLRLRGRQSIALPARLSGQRAQSRDSGRSRPGYRRLQLPDGARRRRAAGAAAVPLPRQSLSRIVGRGAARSAGRVELRHQEHRVPAASWRPGAPA